MENILVTCNDEVLYYADVPHHPGPQLRRAGQQLRACAPGRYLNIYNIYTVYIISTICNIYNNNIYTTLSTRCATGRGEDLRRAVHLHRLQHRGRHH